jgi:hypothetical protein
MSTPSVRRKGSASPSVRKFVMASVKIEVAEHARLSAAAALAGLDKSAWMRRAILEALQGVVVIDRRNSRENAAPETPPPEGQGG